MLYKHGERLFWLIDCRYVDDITWVKQTVNRRMAKGHGYYLQHAKETCLVGKKVCWYWWEKKDR